MLKSTQYSFGSSGYLYDETHDWEVVSSNPSIGVILLIYLLPKWHRVLKIFFTLSNHQSWWCTLTKQPLCHSNHFKRFNYFIKNPQIPLSKPSQGNIIASLGISWIDKTVGGMKAWTDREIYLAKLKWTGVKWKIEMNCSVLNCSILNSKS